MMLPLDNMSLRSVKYVVTLMRRGISPADTCQLIQHLSGQT